MNFSDEDISRLADLLEARYKSDFPGRSNLDSWWLYLKSHKIRPMLGAYLAMREVVSDEDFDETVRHMQGPWDEIIVQILWLGGNIMDFGIRKDLATKVLVLGEFPPRQSPETF